MLFIKHIFNFSQTAAQILMKFGSYMHLKQGYSSLFKSRFYNLCSSNYANELLGSYVTCIFKMYYYFTV